MPNLILAFAIPILLLPSTALIFSTASKKLGRIKDTESDFFLLDGLVFSDTAIHYRLG